MEQLVNVLLVALLSMSPRPPAGESVQIVHWPMLKVTEHLVGTMPSICGASTGCAVVNFNGRTCDIYIALKEPQKAAVREREMKRCRGYDEPPYRLKAAYSQWLANQPCKPGNEREWAQWVVVGRTEPAVLQR